MFCAYELIHANVKVSLSFVWMHFLFHFKPKQTITPILLSHCTWQDSQVSNLNPGYKDKYITDILWLYKIVYSFNIRIPPKSSLYLWFGFTSMFADLSLRLTLCTKLLQVFIVHVVDWCTPHFDNLLWISEKILEHQRKS